MFVKSQINDGRYFNFGPAALARGAAVARPERPATALISRLEILACGWLCGFAAGAALVTALLR